MKSSASSSASDNIIGPVSSINPSTTSASTSTSSRWRQLDVQSLISILASRKGLKSVVELQGEDAVAVVEILDQALESTDLVPAQQKNCTIALRKLCGRCGIIPTSYTLSDGLETIGRWPHAGGMFAEVWEGRYKGRLVAIKALRVYAQDDLIKVKKRFCKESVVWKRLSHPNVLPFLGVSTSPFRFSMISVWMTHGNITDYVKAHPEANRLLLLSDVASGLNYLHTENLVHGDLKGANILINNDYRACLADFGLMVVFHHSLTAYSSTTAMSGGTLRWMAPELLMPEKYGSTRCRLSKESDVYALGMVIYEVITGNVPFHRCITMAVTQMILNGERPERPTDSTVVRISDDLWEMVQLCWHREWIKRPMVHVVLNHLNKATRDWVPPSPTTWNSGLDADDDSDASSAIPDSPYTTEPNEANIQSPAEDDTSAVTDGSPHNDPPSATAGVLRAIAQDAFDTQSSALPSPAAPLDLSQPQVADSSPSTTSMSSPDLTRFISKQRSSSRRLRNSHTDGSLEGIEEIGNQRRLRGATVSSGLGQLRPRDDERASFLTESGNTLIGRFRHTQKLEDLEEAITYYREALELSPPGDPKRLDSLSNLAIAIRARFKQSTKLEDLEELISNYHQVLNLRPTGHPDRSISLMDLALALHDRFEQSQGPKDLEEAISYYRQALDLRPPGHPDQSASLNSVAVALHDQFERSQDLVDLEEAIVFYRQALDLRPPRDPDRPASLNNLAVALHDQFEWSQEPKDLEEAIAYYRQALDLRPPGNPDRSVSLNNLALVLHDRFKRSREPDDLEEAIEYFRETLDLRSTGHPDRSVSLNNLAVAIQDRFRRSRKVEDLEEAIGYFHEALDLRPPGNPERSISLRNLAVVIQNRFQRTRKMEDLEEAIGYFREALELRPPGNPERSISLRNLAVVIQSRFQRTRKMEDLEEAIGYFREALDLRPPGNPERYISLNNLAVALRHRFKRTQELVDLEEVIAHYREALDLRPPGDLNQWRPLNNLALAIQDRFDRTRSSKDSDELAKLRVEVAKLRQL